MNGRTNAIRRVLIVDDDRFATHVLGRLLRRHGYVAAEETDSTKAVQVALRFDPDVMLLDLRMPWKDGREVAADFAADERLCCVPIVFITADALEKVASTRSDPILVKPFSIEDLLARLGEGIARKGEQKPRLEEGLLAETAVG